MTNEARVRRVARLLERHTVDDIIARLGGDPGDGKLKAGVVHIITRHPRLAPALEARVRSEVALNQGRGRNTSVSEACRRTGLGDEGLRAFIPKREAAF